MHSSVRSLNGEAHTRQAENRQGTRMPACERTIGKRRMPVRIDAVERRGEGGKA